MYEKISYGNVTTYDNELLRHRDANKDYLLKLNTDLLLLNHAMEAGHHAGYGDFDYLNIHLGWESPMCQLRGHFAGHWLSAAAMHYAATKDGVVKARADEAVEKLAAFQKANGGQWVCSIPEKYLYWIAKGRNMWAPQYTIHKTLMGLVDMYELAGNNKALDIAMNLAKWFYNWTDSFTREEMDDILDVETGGMLEIWAQLYGITGEEFLKELMERYYRGRLFDPLVEGKDPLMNMHANTTIPEVLGAARAYEVTGEKKWLEVAMAYWDCSVTNRGMYATGGQTCGEIWSPPHRLSARLGDKNQEHCTVYNMMRLAEFLFRHTGESHYADYWERNLYNGVLAQTYWQGKPSHGMKSEYPTTGLISYFLPLRGGGRKGWGSETTDFFCCHGTLVQANAAFTDGIYYQDDKGATICQYISSEVNFKKGGVGVNIAMDIDQLTGNKNLSSVQEHVQVVNDTASQVPHNPNLLAVDIRVLCKEELEFTLRLRIPEWAKGYTLALDGEILSNPETSKGFIEISNRWKNNMLRLEVKKELTVHPLPDEPDTVAFMYGPIVLAGLCDEERTLYGDINNPSSILTPDNEREWGVWQNTFRTKNQERGIRFVPLYRIGYERYSVYFPIRKS